jgi:hypothetical protein
MAKLEKADIQSLLADYRFSADEPCLHLVWVPLSSEPKRTFKGLKSVRANLSALETEMVQRFIHLQCYTEGLRIQQVTSWRKVSPLRVEPKHEQTIFSRSN